MEATTPEQEQFSLQIFIDELDPLIARLAETLAEAERITDSLRGEEEYDEEFHYAYEQSLEAASALIEARRFKEFMLSIAAHVSAKENGAAAPVPDRVSAKAVIRRLDTVIDELQDLALMAQKITADLRAEDGYEEEFNDAYEESIQARSALNLGQQFRELMLSLLPKRTTTA